MTTTFSPIGTPVTLHRVGGATVAMTRSQTTAYAYPVDHGEVDWREPLVTAAVGAGDAEVLALLAAT